jgi:hypothetical protein
MPNENVEHGDALPAGSPPLSTDEQGVEMLDIAEVREFAERGEKLPPARKYRVHIDCEVVTVPTSMPTGEMLLKLVGKRPCAYELIEVLKHCENDVVEPTEIVDLRKHGLTGFITAHKEIVTIFINDKPYPIDKGTRTVADILSKVGETPEGYMLLQEKDGPPLPLPSDVPVTISGCEIFHSQTQTGGSS